MKQSNWTLRVFFRFLRRRLRGGGLDILAFSSIALKGHRSQSKGKLKGIAPSQGRLSHVELDATELLTKNARPKHGAHTIHTV
jgi:hypothetical protein